MIGDLASFFLQATYLHSESSTFPISQLLKVILCVNLSAFRIVNSLIFYELLCDGM